MSDAIKQYISTKYNQHPDMFKQDLLDIDRIRADAVNFMENHISGIRKLTAYAAHLVWMGGKFPVDVSSNTSVYSKRHQGLLNELLMSAYTTDRG